MRTLLRLLFFTTLILIMEYKQIVKQAYACIPDPNRNNNCSQFYCNPYSCIYLPPGVTPAPNGHISLNVNCDNLCLIKPTNPPPQPPPGGGCSQGQTNPHTVCTSSNQCVQQNGCGINVCSANTQCVGGNPPPAAPPQNNPPPVLPEDSPLYYSPNTELANTFFLIGPMIILGFLLNAL